MAITAKRTADAWQGRTIELAKKPYTPSYKGTPVAKPKNFYKNLTNVKGKVSRRTKLTRVLNKKGIGTNYK